MSKLRLLLPFIFLLCLLQNAQATPFDEVEANDVKSLTKSLDNGYNIENINDRGETLAIHAVRFNAKEALKLLLKRGANINRFKVNFNNDFRRKYNPLTTALISNKNDLVRFLVKSGAEINVVFSFDLSDLHGKFLTPLSYTISEEKYEQAKLLVELGADLNHEEFNLYSALDAALDAKKTDFLALLIKNGAVLKNARGFPLLCDAIDKENSKMVSTLLKAKADPNALCVKGYAESAPLIWAIGRENTTIANALLDAGAYVNGLPVKESNQINYSGNTALLEAIKNNSPLVDRLVSMGADLDVLDDESISVPLLAMKHGIPVEPLLTKKNQQDSRLIGAAVKANNLKLLNKLIKLKLNLNEQSYLEEYIPDTPLTFAIKHNYLPLAKTLIKHGAKINVGGVIFPALIPAVELESTEITSLLLARGANPNLYFNLEGVNYSVSPLSVANKQNTKVLLAHGAELNPKSGFSPLMIAALYERVEQIDNLIYFGAKVNAQSSGKFTALMFAAIRRGREGLGIVDKLFANGAKINYIIENGETPLMRVVDKGISSKILSALVKHGADINAIDDAGNTLLHWAARGADQRIFKALLSLGMDKNLHTKNKKGQTPFLVAAKYRNEKVIKLLLSNDYKIDINQHDAENNTALAFSLGKDAYSKEITAILVNNGIDLVMEHGDKPSGLALLADNTPGLYHWDVNQILKNNPDTLQQIVKSPLDPEKLDSFLLGVKRDLVRKNDTHLLQVLLSAGLDPNGLIYGNRQFLTWVISKKKLDLARLLIDAGANVNTEVSATFDYNFPLKEAVSSSNIEAVKLLLNAGAKVELLYKNDYPMSKLKRYHPKIAEVINDHLEAELIRKFVVYVLPVLLLLTILAGLWFFIRRKKKAALIQE